MQDLLTKTFPLDGKIKLSVTGVSENGRRMVSTGQKICFHHQEKDYFSKIGFPLAKNKCSNTNKRMLFQMDRKSVSTSWNGDFV